MDEIRTSYISIKNFMMLFAVTNIITVSKYFLPCIYGFMMKKLTPTGKGVLIFTG